MSYDPNDPNKFLVDCMTRLNEMQEDSNRRMEALLERALAASRQQTADRRVLATRETRRHLRLVKKT
jgi:hypothetical protein